MVKSRDGWIRNGKGVLVPPTDPSHPLPAAAQFGSWPVIPDEGPLRMILKWKRQAPGIVLVLECGHEVPQKAPHMSTNDVPCPECGKKVPE